MWNDLVSPHLYINSKQYIHCPQKDIFPFFANLSRFLPSTATSREQRSTPSHCIGCNVKCYQGDKVSQYHAPFNWSFMASSLLYNPKFHEWPVNIALLENLQNCSLCVYQHGSNQLTIDLYIFNWHLELIVWVVPERAKSTRFERSKNITFQIYV